MPQQTFIKDTQKIYDYITTEKAHVNILFEHLEKENLDKLTIIDEFAQTLDLHGNLTNEKRLSLITRLVSLRDDSLVQTLKKESKTDAEIIELQEKAYLFVKKFWEEKHKKTVDFIKKNNLLTPFYQEIFKGVYNVGLAMSVWQSSWTAHIINGVNKDLMEKFDNKEEDVFKYLENQNLLDLGHNELPADRCYSALVLEGDEYKSKAYMHAFKKETTAVVDALEEFEDALVNLEDSVYNQKWEYVLYLQTLIKAFCETHPHLLVSRWADVDRAWMKIKTPIQIGHPLEYYEDHFRKAVALEWDIRLTSPTLQNNNDRVKKIKNMFSTIFHSFELDDNFAEHKKIFDFSYKSLDKVQLYLGRPALFFGAEFNGLFSAQVVPNDEIVTSEEGKKIFAFSDEILQSSRAKPFLKLQREIFGQEFLTNDRNFLFKEDKKWHQVYDITTIGHEYGHILWCDEETETLMNKTGNFKNIEEFKATTGGLVSFFISNDEADLQTQVLTDSIKRAVGLIGWMEVDEVQPYYCEGLIHLNALFDSEVLTWKRQKLSIDMSVEKYENLKRWYITAYQNLALHYLNKKDATSFLNKYATKEDEYFMPINSTIYSFVEYYFQKYKEIGQELDSSDKKENYL